MIVRTMALALSATMLGSLPSVLVLWRKHKATSSERDQKWRDYQVARLESLVDRMKKAEVAPAPMCYPELPSVPLAGLLPPPRSTRLESGEGQSYSCVY